MGEQKWLDTTVGLFIIAAVVCMLVLAFKVSDFSALSVNQSYAVTADFDNIGDLKPRAAVTIAGVKIGQVDKIVLDTQTYKAIVTIRINNTSDNIPVDSSANIQTQGLLGSNYIAITPGFDSEYLADGGKIQDTHPAIILEEMIGQLLFSMKSDEKAAKDGDTAVESTDKVDAATSN